MKVKNKKQEEMLLEELYSVRNPHLRKPYSKSEIERLRKKVMNGKNISQKAFFDLTTSRNKNLIYPEEQFALQNTTVGFFGLSVGSHAATSWVMLSRANNIKIADPDTIDATNLNRLPYSYQDIGKSKIEIFDQKARAINPYINIISTDKTDSDTTNKLFESTPPIDIVVDEIDDFESKIALRKLSKKYRLPLVSAADIGNNVMLDIERYDEDENLPYFNGRIGDIDKINFEKLTVLDKKKLIIQLVGFEENSERMLDSILSIGGSISTWPQLGPTAQIAGGIVALTLKEIVLNSNVKSGRYYFSLDQMIVADHMEEESVSTRNRKIELIREMLK